jgi:hypothetical protein
MTWDSTSVTTLKESAMDLGIQLAESICRKLDMGMSIDEDVEYLYFLRNIIFSLENSVILLLGLYEWEDEDYTYLSECISRIQFQRNRYRWLS